MRRFTVGLALLLVAVPVELAAQTSDLPAPGSRVRLSIARDAHVSAGQRIVGTLLTIDGDSVAVADLRGSADQVHRVPMASLRQLEVSTGRRTNRTRAALIGGAAFGTLALIGAAVDPCEPDPWNVLDYCDSPVVMGVLGFASGALVGALVGGWIRTDRWQPVVLSADGPVRAQEQQGYPHRP